MLAVQVFTPTINKWGFPSTTISSAITVICFIDLCHIDWYKMKSQNSFDFYFPGDIGHFFKCFSDTCVSSFQHSLFRYVSELLIVLLVFWMSSFSFVHYIFWVYGCVVGETILLFCDLLLCWKMLSIAVQKL